ncbi:class C beta-lactamase [Massilia dura]|uniref:Beta-lactamase n=1 Tax=Pseudoduganella dura TaxID=321982 RepID=A0A6I3XD93_9BURK|nr:class C beta-lactamase [Pseudoduganella dura]MUI14904.1 class C beta-lactamase [Pseudoduganella dura]GGY01594.1 beta-lactamase [Pseudoduganella dura]
MLKRPFKCLPLFLALASPAFAADNATRLRAVVDAAIGPLMAEHGVPGMAVGIIVDGQPAVFNYGVASKEHGTPVGPETLFELGSISKTFTATLAAYAQAQGKLGWEDHPGKYVPQLAGSAVDRATLRELGTYTAGGLPLQFPDDVTNEIDWLRQWQAAAPPGTQRRYSNPSIGLLGHVAARALGQDFGTAVETRLFPGFGMRHSHVKVPAAAMANYAWGYNGDGRPVRVNPGAFDAEAYGVKSTATDMLRFLQANIDPGRLETPLRQAVAATHVGYFDMGPMVQGLGWEQYPYPVALERLVAGNSPKMSREANPAKPIAPGSLPAAPVLFNKTGSTGGFGAYAAFVPARKIGIVMLANKAYPNEARVKAAHAILTQLGQPVP